MLRALVLDGQTVTALEVVQSLARRGVHVDVAATKDCIAFKSRRIQRRFLQPVAEKSAGFIDWIRAVDAEGRYSLIVPPTEISLLPFVTLPDDDPIKMKAALAPREALATALNKFSTISLAQRLGVPVPETRFIDSIEDAPKVESYPVVLKPISSKVMSGGRLHGVPPVLVRNECERRWHLISLLERTPVLQQEYVSGWGVGVELLYRRGEMLWHFCHERVHEGSGMGGLGSGSSYRRSAIAPPEMLHHAKNLLDALQWHGVAMVEFKVTATGRFWLMEINPRLWGSVALAIDAGVDFPYGLLCLAAGLPIPPQPRYRVPYFTRELFRDVEWLKARLVGRPDFSAITEILRLCRPLAGVESWDLFDWRDPRTTVYVLRDIISYWMRGKKSRISSLRLRRLAKRQHANTLARIKRLGRTPQQILFLCHGNIHRSPAAQALAARSWRGVNVSSAGFYESEGRPVSENFQLLIRSMGLDLSQWSSRRVSSEMVDNADLVVLMDLRNFRDYSQQFPAQLHKVVFLGMFMVHPMLSIDDPYGGGPEESLRVLKQIEAGITGLRSVVTGAQRAQPPVEAPAD
jgi:protein-tyrosine-phosphatase/predicted ATP-grasp superfamily ATP-dependent carboligase